MFGETLSANARKKHSTSLSDDKTSANTRSHHGKFSRSQEGASSPFSGRNGKYSPPWDDPESRKGKGKRNTTRSDTRLAKNFAAKKPSPVSKTDRKQMVAAAFRTESATPSDGKQQRKRFERLEGKTKPRKTTSAIRLIAGQLRLNKFLAEAGVVSRRKADVLIQRGAVTINGKVVTELGIRVEAATDVICVDGAQVFIEAQLVYILLNKPKDCITTTDDEKGRTTVLDLLPRHQSMYPIGRLDRNTTGVLLVTNDGDLAYALTHPKFHVAKVYRADIDRKMLPHDITRLRRGIKLEEGMTAPCDVFVLDPPHNVSLLITLHEGKNRQVRRMIEALNYKVKRLERIEYAGLTTAGLKRGGWRYLDETEIRRLKKYTRTSMHGIAPERESAMDE